MANGPGSTPEQPNPQQPKDQPGQPKQEQGQPQRVEKTGIGNRPQAKPESREAQRGIEMRDRLAFLAKDQQAEDIGMLGVWERAQNAGLPREITTSKDMQLFIDHVLPECADFQTLKKEWDLYSQKMAPNSLLPRLRGALFQIVCAELLRYKYKDAPNIVVLSALKTENFFKKLYPNVDETFGIFSVLNSLQSIPTPDALVVTVEDVITKGPLVFTEMQATLSTDPNHYTNEVRGLQGRLRQVRVNGALRLAYREDTSLVAMTPNRPAYKESVQMVVDDLDQRNIPVEIEQYPVPLTGDMLGRLVTNVTRPNSPQQDSNNP